MAATPLEIALIGAGNRGGRVYADSLRRHPELARLAFIAEPDGARRKGLAALHGLSPDRLYASWEDLFETAPAPDAVIIATPDRLHLGPAIRALELGYPILLEKPIAPTREEVLRLARAASCSRGSVTVAHVLRYTAFFATLKRLLDEGRIGRLMTATHLENVGYWHFAHSFVRGNWRKLSAASPMILAKACHDLDLLRWLVGAPCLRVASFGGLGYFKAESAPVGAGERCLDCAVERGCPYSAVRFYLEEHAENHGWPVSAMTADTSPEGRLKALRSGPYGRCVYRCDNDVADHQVVALEFAGAVTATLTVSAFTSENTRTLKLMGSQGEIRGHLDKGEIEVRGFLDNESDFIRVAAGPDHAGGDDGLMRSFLERLHMVKAGLEVPEALSSLAASTESHLMAFAAEEARAKGTVVKLGDLEAQS
ncbi:Gfo/Idh/MocA family oxidoreductase [soil metagenome]